MKKFMVLYHMPAELAAQTKDKTPEEMAEGMKPWMEWAEKCGDKLVDMGQPLGGGQRVTTEGTSSSDKDVAGYSILQAESIDDAVALLNEHPHITWNEKCSIEVHEMFPIPS